MDFAYEEGEPVIEASDFRSLPRTDHGSGRSQRGREDHCSASFAGHDRTGKRYLYIPVGKRASALRQCGEPCPDLLCPPGQHSAQWHHRREHAPCQKGCDGRRDFAALKQACAWEFINKLPKGINDSIYERGKGLSEGQAQRIAIARALLRKAPVLLMDEATSALDVDTEKKVLQKILNKAPDHTCIITTHRPSVLSMSDRVYRVIDKHIVLLNQEEVEKLVHYSSQL